MNARHQRGESRHEAYLAQVAKRAGDESTKVNEVRFITSLNEENKKFLLRQKLYDSEMRRAEKLQVIKTKQKEDTAREEAVLERRKFLEAEKMQRLAEIQRKKEEAIFRREEERKASSAAREARAAEQQRRKEIRAKAQQEEAELLAQKLAEKLRESEQRRKYHLEQIPMQRPDLGIATEKRTDIPSQGPQGDENSTTDSFLERKKVNNIGSVYNNSPGKGNETNLKQPVMLLLSAMAETGLVSVPSLLTAVLLQANNRSSSPEQAVVERLGGGRRLRGAEALQAATTRRGGAPGGDYAARKRVGGCAEAGGEKITRGVARQVFPPDAVRAREYKGWRLWSSSPLLVPDGRATLLLVPAGGARRRCASLPRRSSPLPLPAGQGPPKDQG
nr:unnamed protein product [Digitaria exilis]